MLNELKMMFAESGRQRSSNQCNHLRLVRKLRRDDLHQDCEWERRMKQLNPTWNPSSHSLEAYL